MERDNIHYSTRKIDSYNKPFNFIVSAREAGKTTTVLLDKVYKWWLKDGSTSLFLLRDAVSITDEYITKLIDTIETFNDVTYKVTYTKESMKKGTTTIFLDNKPFIMILSMNMQIIRIKKLGLKNIRFIVVDEFICNWKFGEKYLKGETEKFEEIYKTFRRDATKRNIELKCYFLGNPYSRYNPYFLWLNADIDKIEPGTIQTGDVWVIENYRLSEELYQKILKTDPLFKIDDAYREYALNGESVNDKNININQTLPNNFKLWNVLAYNDKYIGIYRTKQIIDPNALRFHIRYINKDTFTSQRDVYCFDLSDVYNQQVMMDRTTKWGFDSLKGAMRNGLVSYYDTSTFYIMKDLFNQF